MSQSHGWDALVNTIYLEAAWQTYCQRMFWAGFGSHIGDRLEFAHLLTEHLTPCCSAEREVWPEPYGDKRDAGRTFHERCTQCKEAV